LGAFASGSESDIRLGVSDVGVTIDVEDVLGMASTTTVVRSDMNWRFTDNNRHRANFSWFAIRRDADTTLGQDITIEGAVIPAGSQVNSALDLDIFKLGYAYSFFQDDRMNLALSGGLFVMPIGFELTASGLVNECKSASVTAPLPALGVQTDFAISKKWFLKGALEVFYLELGDFRGSIIDASMAVEYKTVKNVGFGLAFDSFNISVDAQGRDYPQVDFFGSFDYKYAGFFPYGKVFF